METEIVYNALKNLEDPGHISGRFEAGGKLDGKISLHFPYRPSLRLGIEIKKELRQHQIPQLLQRKQEYGNFMLVAGRLHPAIKKRLQEEEINYLEENGNIFILNDGTYVFIDTNKPLKTVRSSRKKAFTKTGLKLVFSFLIDPELVNATQRTIAEKSNVSLGTVPKVMKALKDEGFLIAHKNNYLWEDRKALLDRWINDYEQQLKPQLFRARYELRKDWQNLQLNPGETHWGGEPAGDLLTGYLRPEKFILYSNESPVNLMKNYSLRPNAEGELFVYEKFWKRDFGPAVSPFLVYADLILREDKRCRETAQKIYDEYIQPVL
ncbi:type IV toxin-antitoxin system AbiEi family antitoxin [Autumnicola edwardsiae]|uniref:Type IV toxin-antitoxin system AbiEi family antitoxin n=1 Tax=Autumnicola edwardsiae TaxID=3075594 RepID=A0ABU3CYH0_9FLAO|nr:type IV toxin-antitoxin system AbiEi family antitoxin [Zunongwangia sp. F297]MDT0651423.1 type IV toxin-antitoxin system AbiEi family antitoxin [Zunongwangia sp. F297]